MNRALITAGVVVAALLLVEHPARAQFCNAAIPHVELLTPPSQSAVAANPSRPKPVFSIGYYPLAKFDFAYPGSKNNVTGISFSNLRNHAEGNLIAAEALFPRNNGTSIAAGTWWYNVTGGHTEFDESSTLGGERVSVPYAIHPEVYEFHLRYDFNTTYGIQVGNVHSTEAHTGPFNDEFVVINPPLGKLAQNPTFPVGLQVGLGGADDYTFAAENHGAITGFVDGNIGLGKYAFIDGSYWVVNSYAPFNRYALGFGVRF